MGNQHFERHARSFRMNFHSSIRSVAHKAPQTKFGRPMRDKPSKPYPLDFSVNANIDRSTRSHGMILVETSPGFASPPD